ncbi:hypothetical protein ISCGN_029036 [Ixodes scapularis]
MATDESMDDDDDNNDASTDDPCERRSLHGRVEGSPSRGRSSSPHCTRPLDLEHRKAGTPRGGSPRQGGRRGTEELGNRPAQGSPPQEPEAPSGRAALQRRGTGPNPRGTETGPTKAPGHRLAAHSDGRPQIGARRQPRTAPLNAHPEPRTREPAARNPLAPPHPPLPQTSLGDSLLPPSSCARAQTGTRAGPGEQPPSDTHAAGRLSVQPHEAQDRVGEGALTATRYATGRTGRRRWVQPSCGKGCRRNGTPCGTGPSHVRNSSRRDQSQDGRTRSDCLSTRGTARV